MTSGKLLRAATCALLLAGPSPATAQQAGGVPYFRFNVGPGKAAKADGKTDDATQLGSNVEPLRFAAAGDPPAAATVGQGMSLSFSSAGGGTSHTLTEISHVPGLRIVSNGPRDWVLSGVLDTAGTFSGGVRLTDEKGARVDHAFPTLTVSPAATTPQSLRFVLAPDIPTVVPMGQSTYSAITFSGGSGTDRTVTASGLPPGYSVTVDAGSWYLSGTPAAKGSFPASSYTVTDGAGGSATHNLPGVSVVDAPAPDVLRFDQAYDLPSTIPYGEWAEASYQIAGGAPPYRFRLARIPGSFSANLDDSADPYGSLWSVNGSATVPGTYPDIQVTATDANGASITRTMPPVTVLAGQAAPLAFSSIQDPDGPVPAQSDLAASYGATGGIAPYTMSVLNAPDLVMVQNGQDQYSFPSARGEFWHMVGAVSAPGTYRGIVVRLTDSAGTSVDHALSIVVTAGSQDPLAFSASDDPPAAMDASSVVDLGFGAAGGSGRGYTMTFVNGPKGIDFPMPDFCWGNNCPVTTSFRLSGTPESFGTFRDAYVALQDDAGHAVYHKVPPFTVTEDNMAPLRVTQEIASTLSDPAVYPDGYFDLYGNVSGGKKPYSLRFVAGLPLTDMRLSYNSNSGAALPFPFPGGEGGGSGGGGPSGNVDLYVGDSPGAHAGIKVRVTDAKGDAVDFQPFGFEVRRPPISGCYLSHYPDGPMVAAPGESANATLFYSGGQQPFSYSYGGTVPKELGLTYEVYNNSQISVTMTPTGQAVTQGGSIVVTDANGGSCSATLEAASVGMSGFTMANMDDLAIPGDASAVSTSTTSEGEPLYVFHKGYIQSRRGCIVQSVTDDCSYWPYAGANIAVGVTLRQEDMTRLANDNSGWGFSMSGQVPSAMYVDTPRCYNHQYAPSGSASTSCGPGFRIGPSPDQVDSLVVGGPWRFQIVSSFQGELFVSRPINVKVVD